MEENLHESQPEISSLELITAPSKVFAIPELIEMVLVHLPALDVLFCQSINSTCRGIVRTSGALQEKLFYKCDLANVDVNNPIASDDLLRLETNPFIQFLHRRQVLARQKDEDVDDNSFGKLDYAEACWKKLYLTRPALCTIDTRKKVSPPDPGRECNIRLSESDGIRMHHLQEIDLSRFTLPNSRYCIRCIGALASNKEKQFSKYAFPWQITVLHLAESGSL